MKNIAKSYTQWSVYKKCPAQYKFKYIVKVPTPQKSDAAERGTDIHAVVEGILKGELEGMPPEYSHLDHYVPFFQNLKEKGAIAELGFRLTREWKTAPDDSDEVYVRGFIDVLVPRGDVVYIYELKSGKVWPDHLDQRHFYGTVALHLYPDADKVKVIGTYLDQGKNEENIYPRSMLSTYRYMWNQRMDQMDNDEHMAANPGFHCRWCPYSTDKGGPCKFRGD